MEQKINLQYFIKIVTFIFLTRINYFYTDVNTFDKFLNKWNNFNRILYTKNYRTLANYGDEIYSSISGSEKRIPYCVKKKNERRFIINNEKWNKKKSEHSYKSSLINKLGTKKPIKYNKIFNTTHYHIEKSFLNALDKMCFLKKIRITNDDTYRKLKRKKYGLRFSLLLIFFLLVLMIPILDLSFTYLVDKKGLLGILGLLSVNVTQGSSGRGWIERGKVSGVIASWLNLGKHHITTIVTTTTILLYCMPFVVSGVTLILAIIYYYKNVIKHKKIKYMKVFN
ncbi:Plasmodium exported protein, unknown function [Plasmodium malariae]|uniref:Fam-l protein n=1 Tax=Plasmodium malariae TaxID=5858 RepID=A0A1D3JIZ3_PLAMA|nr:Plasmodium exported protein, unknown function [Plasmodium malariae]SBT86366.1 Plasmodium exported protein, unknown function [Plasmodium malariae]